MSERALSVRVTEKEQELASERADHDALRVAVGLAMADLGMEGDQGVSSMAVRASGIPDHVRGQIQETRRSSIQRCFSIARSHYSNIDLEALSEGYAPGTTDEEVEELDAEVLELALALSLRIEDEDKQTPPGEN